MAKKKKKGLAAVLGTVVSVAVPFFAPAIAGAIGLSGSVAAAAAIGAAGGAAGSALSGGNILTGAVLGGIGGGVSGLAAAKPAAAAGLSTPGVGNAVAKTATLPQAGTVYAGKAASEIASIASMGPQTILPKAGLTVGAQIAPGQPANLLPPGSPNPTQVAPSGAVTSTPNAPAQLPGQSPIGTGTNTSITPNAGAAKTITDPNAMRQAQLAQQSGQTANATVKAAPTQIANTSGQTPQRAGLLSRVGQYAQPIAMGLSALMSPEPEVPDLSGLFADMNGGPGSPNDGILTDARAAADQADAANQEVYKYRFEQGRTLANRADKFDPYELGQKEGFASSERSAAAADAAAREEAAMGGRNTGRRRRNKRRAGLDAARQSAVGYDRGFRTGVDTSLAYKNAALSWMPSSYSPVDRMQINTAGQNAATQRANVEAAQYELEQSAARDQQEWAGALSRLISGAGNYRQPGQQTENDLYRRAGLFT